MIAALTFAVVVALAAAIITCCVETWRSRRRRPVTLRELVELDRVPCHDEELLQLERDIDHHLDRCRRLLDEHDRVKRDAPPAPRLVGGAR